MLKSVPLASMVLAGLPPAFSQNDDTGLEQVVVTAQKREEDLQSVPVSVTALGTAKLADMQVKEFTDYAKLLPSVSYQSLGPGATTVYMRGIASGENANHSGPLPSVGIYLDEQPITTIQGALDIHVYDIARVEALSGPQGTLYGASSQAGTIRIITNKPDPRAFAASYDLQMETVARGDRGYLGEGFVNVPLSDSAAVRLVGWARHDGGYIDNVLGSLTYPSLQAATGDGTVTNADRVKKNYNDVDTYGGRAALKIDLDDAWTLTPTVMGQAQKTNGAFAYDPKVGDLKVVHFRPEFQRDNWWQAALTIEGKIANLDVVYAGAHLKRDIHSSADYADYSYFYDVVYGYGAYIYNDAGQIIDPTQYFLGNDAFYKDSHELRVSSDPTKRLKFVAGLFWEQQEHDIEQRYKIDGFASFLTPTGWPDTIWLTEQVRTDRDRAAFGEVTLDITPKLSATAGVRFFKANNSLKGFFGYGLGFSPSGSGEAQCAADRTQWVEFHGAPCINLDKNVEASGNTPRYNLTYRFDDARLVYVTYAEGFRPGGINRRSILPPYKPDYLKNYEIGWKTSWLNNRLRVNGAVYYLDWTDIQFSYLGLNGLTEIKNANKAKVKGVEGDIDWAVTSGLTLSGGFAYTDAKLAANYCGTTQADGTPITDCADPLAPDGTRLPVSSKFKGHLTARYGFPLKGFEAHVQGSIGYRTSVFADLRLPDRALVGEQPAYAMTDLSTGVSRDTYAIELYVHNLFDKRGDTYRTTECSIYGPDPDNPQPLCGLRPYSIPDMPRTVGLRFGQRF
ncbi:MAG TPA: TonB-dependent receptor [Steroidobacteraceae bacterium]|nr:TonB-dependent receptor [Steroidobacteraceae bacterium]